MDIGFKIKKYRDNRGLSQEELADRIYISRQTLSNWENNKYYPDIKSIIMLCDIFNVTLDDFIRGDLEKMKRKVEESDLKGFKVLSWLFTFEMFIMVISAYPLLKYSGIIGICIWILFVVITLVTALIIEKYKKSYDIQTYKEIIAFYEKRELTRDEKSIESGKKKYQNIILAICSGLIAIMVLTLMHLILK